MTDYFAEKIINSAIQYIAESFPGGDGRYRSEGPKDLPIGKISVGKACGDRRADAGHLFVAFEPKGLTIESHGTATLLMADIDVDRNSYEPMWGFHSAPQIAARDVQAVMEALGLKKRA